MSTIAKNLLTSNAMFCGLPAAALEALAHAAKLVDVAEGEVLIRQGDRADSFFLVAEGRLVAKVARGDDPDVEIGVLSPGDMLGEASLVGRGRRGATVVAQEPSVVLRIDRDAFDVVLADHRDLLDGVGHVMRQRALDARLRSVLDGLLPPEGALEVVSRASWLHVPRGATVFEEGDDSEYFYLVVDGRLGDFRPERKTDMDILSADLRRGDTFGELEQMLGIPRTRTIRALRDSTVVRFGKRDFDEMMTRYPSLLLGLVRRQFVRLVPGLKEVSSFPTMTLGLVPAHPSIDIDLVGRAIEAAFQRVGATVARVTSAQAGEAIGVEGLRALPNHDPNWLRADLWLDMEADRVSVFLLQADPGPTVWTLRVATRSDQVIAVADGDVAPEPSFIDRLLPNRNSRASMMLSEMRSAGMDHGMVRRSLLALHAPTTGCPRGTRRWLDAVDAERVFHARTDREGDLDRLARILGGRAFGLVLGGGGARGFAHVGVFRALSEAGIEPDFLGGTSFGAIAASQIARGLAYDELTALNSDCVAVNAFSEYTVPMVSLLKSTKIDQLAEMSGEDYDIDDLWIPYFAISADLTNARMVVHESGPVARAIRASGSLPGIVLPVVHGQSLLVDGGIINNLPADVMRRRVGKNGVVVGVDVSPERELAMRQEDFPSQWMLARQAVFGRRDPEIPTIVDVLMRSTILSSIDRMAKVSEDLDILLQPDMRAFRTLDFEKMHEIIEAGYQDTLGRLDEIRAALHWLNPVRASERPPRQPVSQPGHGEAAGARPATVDEESA